MPRQQQADQAALDRFKQLMLQGVDCLKYGRRGSPHVRTFNIRQQNNRTVLCWNHGSKSIDVSTVVAVLSGRCTPILLQKADPAADHLCFAVITPEYSLSLQTESAEQRKFWLDGLRLLLPQAAHSSSGR